MQYLVYDLLGFMRLKPSQELKEALYGGKRSTRQ
jgi:hypothetical protein